MKIQDMIWRLQEDAARSSGLKYYVTFQNFNDFDNGREPAAIVSLDEIEQDAPFWEYLVSRNLEVRHRRQMVEPTPGEEYLLITSLEVPNDVSLNFLIREKQKLLARVQGEMEVLSGKLKKIVGDKNGRVD